MTDRDYLDGLKWEFALFVERCFRQLNPGVPFVGGWHIDVLSSWVVLCQDGEARIIINLPPRHLKSLIGSVALPAFILGHDPSKKIICVSYVGELSEQFSRECRLIMESSWYRAVFPNTRLVRTRSNELVTSRHGSRFATSIDGPLTGRGADLIIIDDPIKPDDALSDTLRKKPNNWFDNTGYTRLNDKRGGSILVIMQRVHEDDLTGHLMARGGWNLLALPAIAEKDQSYRFELVGKHVWHHRKAGEALHPEREPLETLEEVRRNIGVYNFAGQYQQAPAPLEGGMVKRGWFKEYSDADRPERFDLILQSWDTANKASELADYSVCTTWGLAGTRIYLLHVLRKKLDYPSLKRNVREQMAIHAAEVVLIEDKASGTQLIQELSAEGMFAVTPYKPEGGLTKQMRMHAQTGWIENGLVYLPKAAEWRDDYVHELTTFPASKNDDQVDSTAQALHWITMGRPRKPGLLAYYEQLIEERSR